MGANVMSLLDRFKSKQVDVEGMSLKVPSDMSWCFGADGYYEKNVTYWLRRIGAGQSNATFYDIGANIGFYVLLMSRYVQSIVAFEPVSKTYKTLTENIRDNKIENVFPYNCGLSDKSGDLAISLYNSSGNNSLYNRTVPPGHGLKKIGSQVISLVQLDRFVLSKMLPMPTMMKIDIEGAELSALRGASRILTEGQPVIFMELSENTCADAGYSPNDLVKYLTQYGYQFMSLPEDPEDFTLSPYSVGDRVENVLALPKGYKI